MLDNVIQLMIGDAAISALVGTRIKPNRAKVKPARPYIIAEQITREPNHHTEGAGMIARTVQITAFADTYLSAKAVAGAVEDLLDDFSGNMAGLKVEHSALSGQQVLFEQEIDAHSVQTDFRIRARS